jgi:hypothetical protein
MKNNSLTDIINSRQQSITERVKFNSMVNVLPKNGLMSVLFPELTNYKLQKPDSSSEKVLKNINKNFSLFAKNSKKLNSISSNFLVMKGDVNKFAKSQNVRPRLSVNERTDSVTTVSRDETTPSFVKSEKGGNMILMISALALAITIGYKTLGKSFDTSIEKLMSSLPNLGNNIYERLKKSFEDIDFTSFIQNSASKINDEIKNSFDEAKNSIINSEIAKKIKNVVSGREPEVDDSTATAKPTAKPTDVPPEQSGDSTQRMLAELRKREGKYDSPAHPLSSARGAYGITAPAYTDIAKKDTYFAGKDQATLTPADQDRAVLVLRTINQDRLRAQGVEPTEANQQLAHFLGAKGAADYLKNGYISPEAAAANGGLEKTRKIAEERLALGRSLSMPTAIKKETKEPLSTQAPSTSPKPAGKDGFVTWSQSMRDYGEMKTVNGAVIHHTGGGSMSGAIETLKQRGLSYHYMIDKNGTVKQLIPGKGIGYHAGYGPNQSTFGIALVAENDRKVTPEQIQAASNLNAKLASEYGYDSKNVFGHGEISKNKMATEGKTVVDFITKSAASKKDQSLLLLLQAGADLNYKNQESVANFERQKKLFHSNKGRSKNQNVASNNPNVLPYLLDRLSNNIG